MEQRITYIRKDADAQGPRDVADYVFDVRDYGTVSVGIAGGWHELYPPIKRALAINELKAMARDFLEENLAAGWRPTPTQNRVEIPHNYAEQWCARFASEGA